MAEDNPQPTSEQPVLDAAQLESALAHLEQLQDKLDSAKTVLQTLIVPLVRPPYTRAELFTELKRHAAISQAKIDTFREDWTSERTQALLVQSRESRRRDGNCAKASLVPVYGYRKLVADSNQDRQS